MADRIQLRRDTAANWTSANPVLADGEIGIERDTDQFKVGDGATAWAALAYGGIQGPQGATGPAGADSTVAGPAGADGASVASAVANTPAGNIIATTVQTAINELDTEKQAALGFTPYNATNPSNFIDAAGAPVQSVGGFTGAVTKTQLDLNNVSNTADADKPVSTAQADADAATLASANAHSDALVVGLWDDRGSFNASVNTYPAAGGSGTAGAILKGDIWTINVVATAGVLLGYAVGTNVRAVVDTPGQTGSNWAVTEVGLGYVAENTANKNASGGYPGLTLFKLNLRNAANTITSWFTTAATVARTWTMPDYDGTVSMQAGTETLTNKTLTTPVINGAATGTGVATAATANTLVMRGAAGEITGAAGSFTALSAIGTVTSTATNVGFSQVNTGSTTYQYSYSQNLSGYAIFGVEGASPALITGATAYDTVVRGQAGIAFSANGGTGMQMRLSTTGLNSTVIGATTPAAGSFTTLSATVSVNHPSYTVATVPSAATAGATIYVSNAGGNGPCIAVANGSVWQRCDNTSTTVS